MVQKVDLCYGQQNEKLLNGPKLEIVWMVDKSNFVIFRSVEIMEGLKTKKKNWMVKNINFLERSRKWISAIVQNLIKVDWSRM